MHGLKTELQRGRFVRHVLSKWPSAKVVRDTASVIIGNIPRNFRLSPGFWIGLTS